MFHAKPALRPLLIALAAGLLVPAGADAAAVRHAATTGSGTACTAVQPCQLTKAVELAADGDDVVIAPGQYEATGIGTPTTSVDLRGASSADPPTLVVRQNPELGACSIDLEAGSLRDLRIKKLGGGNSVCAHGDLTVTRVTFWSDGGFGTAFSVLDADEATFRSTSIDMADGSWSGILLGGVEHATLDHVTVDSPGSAVQLNQPVDDGTTTVSSSVLRSSGADARDIAIFCNAQTHVITVKDTAHEDADDGECTLLDGGGNRGSDDVTWAPFTDGVLRPGAGSPLIDAAPARPATERDVDDQPRSLGTKSDMGADETPQAPSVGAPAAIKVGDTTADVRAYVLRRRADVDVRVRYGDGSGVETLAPSLFDGTATLLGERAMGHLTGLRPATTYTARVVVTNPFGQSAESKQITFTTDPAPAAPSTSAGTGTPAGTTAPPTTATPRAAAGDRRAPRCTLRTTRTRKGLKLIGRCDEAGTLTLKLGRKGGRRALKRTVRITRPGKVSRTLKVKHLRSASFTVRDAAGNATTASKLKLRRR